MKFWHKGIPAVLLGATVLLNGLFPLTAHSQDANGRKMLYLFSFDFPQDVLVQYPSPPVQETRFWQLLDHEMQATPDLTLTENMEKADYRVEIRCGGALNCSHLDVNVKDSKRNFLTSFEIKRIDLAFGLWKPNLAKVARELTIRLDEHLRLLDQGGYGYSEN